MNRTTWGLLLAVLVACGPSGGREVTRLQYGEAWPFTVAKGTVDCDAQGRAIFRTQRPDPSGVWALTGEARAYGYPAIDPFWRENPSMPGTRVPLTEMVRLALEQCR